MASAVGHAAPWARPAVAAVAAAFSLALSLAGCTGSDPQAEPEPDPVPAAQADIADLLAVKVDEVRVMHPGGRGERPPVFDPSLTVQRSRHVLRVETPQGPADLFVTQATDEQDRWECTELAFGDGASSSCRSLGNDAAGNAGRPQPMVQSSLGWEALTLVDLVGPEDTTHLIVTTDGRRLGLVAIEGRAVLWSKVDPCALALDRVEAWKGDVLLRSEEPDGWC